MVVNVLLVLIEVTVVVFVVVFVVVVGVFVGVIFVDLPVFWLNYQVVDD